VKFNGSQKVLVKTQTADQAAFGGGGGAGGSLVCQASLPVLSLLRLTHDLLPRNCRPTRMLTRQLRFYGFYDYSGLSRIFLLLETVENVLWLNTPLDTWLYEKHVGLCYPPCFCGISTNHEQLSWARRRST